MLFKKNAQPNPEEQDRDLAAVPQNMTAAAAQAARSRVRYGFFQCALVLVVLSVAVFAWGTTHAWFATNREAQSDNSTVVSETASASLFISAGTQAADKLYHLGLVSNWPNTAKLFPISTRSLSDTPTWWYVDTFGTGLDASGTAYDAKATHYTSVTTSNGLTETDVTTSSAGIATYDNTLDGDDKVAYAFSTYKLYTNTGSMDIYLDPTEPIVVSYSAIDASGKDLMSALRVGIAVDGTMKFIYAPITETGTGNSQGQSSANTFYGVNSATEATTLATVLTSLNDWKATATGNAAAPYSAATNSLGTATTTGIQVKVFVWLEGTDAQAILGVSDNDIQGIQVHIKYVGIAQ